MERDRFTVSVASDGSLRVDNADGTTAYVTGMSAEDLRNRYGRQVAVEEAIGYIAARLVSASNGFTYRGSSAS